MRKAGIVGLGVGLVAAGVIAWAVMRGAGGTDDPLSVTSPGATALGIDAMDTPEVPRLPAVKPERPDVPSPTASRPALPPVDMPFNQGVEALEEAARGGDVVAACRLTTEAWRCFNARQMARFVNEEERQIEQLASRDLDAEQLEQRIDAWMDRKQSLEATMASCEGVDVSFPKLFDYDWLATTAGDPVARLRYLGSMHLTPGVLIRHPELLDHYRTHAFDIFMQALETGDLGAVQLWQSSAQFDNGFALYAVLPEPWQDPRLVSAVIEQLTEDQRAAIGFHLPVDSEPSPEQQAEAARIHARYFAATPAKQSSSFADVFGGHEPDTQRCEDLAH